MSKPVPHFAVTANRLRDGVVVYVAADVEGAPRWSTRWEDAQVTASEATRDALVAWAKGQSHEVCGPYALDIAVEGEVRRLSQRERLRAAGPAEVLERLRLRPADLNERTKGAR